MFDTTLGELATLVRAKNAGPFWLTLDVFFATDADYARAAGVLTKDAVGDLYRTEPAAVRLYRLPNIRVIKASLPRPVVQGSFVDRDMHSGQQHIPLAGLPVSNTREF
jgi:hypothetical protein